MGEPCTNQWFFQWKIFSIRTNDEISLYDFFFYILRLFDCHSYLQGENQSQEEKPSFQNADLRADNQLTVSQLLLTRLKNEPRTTKSYKHDYSDTICRYQIILYQRWNSEKLNHTGRKKQSKFPQKNKTKIWKCSNLIPWLKKYQSDLKAK